MLHAQWVFDCDVPLDEFERRMRAALERNGWITGKAQVYDFWGQRAGVRAFVKLGHHDWGVQVSAKLKPGWLSNGKAHLKALWEAAREAQVAGATATSPRAGPSRADTY